MNIVALKQSLVRQHRPTLPDVPVVIKPLNPVFQYKMQMTHLRKKYFQEQRSAREAKVLQDLENERLKQEKQRELRMDIALFKAAQASKTETEAEISQNIVFNDAAISRSQYINSYKWAKMRSDIRTQRFYRHLKTKEQESDTRKQHLTALFYASQDFITYSNLDAKLDQGLTMPLDLIIPHSAFQYGLILGDSYRPSNIAPSVNQIQEKRDLGLLRSNQLQAIMEGDFAENQPSLEKLDYTLRAYNINSSQIFDSYFDKQFLNMPGSLMLKLYLRKKPLLDSLLDQLVVQDGRPSVETKADVQTLLTSIKIRANAVRKVDERRMEIGNAAKERFENVLKIDRPDLANVGKRIALRSVFVRKSRQALQSLLQSRGTLNIDVFIQDIKAKSEMILDASQLSRTTTFNVGKLIEKKLAPLSMEDGRPYNTKQIINQTHRSWNEVVRKIWDSKGLPVEGFREKVAEFYVEAEATIDTIQAKLSKK